jgi:hypothetical protein
MIVFHSLPIISNNRNFQHINIWVGVYLKSAIPIPMAKDHSCLFHAISYGLKLKYDGHILRRRLYEYVTSNPVAYDNIKDYYDNYSHTEYGIVLKHKDYWGGPPELQ